MIDPWREPVLDDWVDYNGHLSEAYYVLVSLMDEAKPVVRAFRIVDSEITEEPIEIV